MKKRLEAELISIAHRVLKLKNKSEIDQLYHETQKLYEALTVLKFYGDNYEQVKSDVAVDDLEDKVIAFVEDKAVVETPKAVETEAPQTIVEETPIEEKILAVAEQTNIEEKPLIVKEEIEAEEKTETAEEPVIVGEITIEEDEVEEEPVTELKSDLDFEPIFELAAESPIEDVVKDKTEVKIETPKKETKQISFEDLLGENYTEPVFVKPNDIVVPPSLKNIIDEKPLSLNDQHSKAINIGMNDRIAFVKHLFADSNEDFNRVISQLNTFSSSDEAKDFIEEIIKPDYNNWIGSEEYAERFLEIVANKFN
jgi:hypothetical protein